MKKLKLFSLALMALFSMSTWGTDLEIPLTNLKNFPLDYGLIEITNTENTTIGSNQLQSNKTTAKFKVTTKVSGFYLKTISFTDASSSGKNGGFTCDENESYMTKSSSVYTYTAPNTTTTEANFSLIGNGGTAKMGTIKVTISTSDQVERLSAFSGISNQIISCTSSAATSNIELSVPSSNGVSVSSSRISIGSGGKHLIVSGKNHKLIKYIAIPKYQQATYDIEWASTPAGTATDDVWAPTSSSAKSVDLTLTVSSTVYSQEVYVVYEDATTYIVSYNNGGGSGTMTDSNSPYEAGDEVTLLENTFEAPDASSAWSGWDVYKTGEPATKVPVTDGKFTMPAYNVTVAAQWATAYDVKFFQGYGEPDVQIGETQSIGEGAFAIAPADPERAGYQFAGWSYDATKANVVNVDEYAISAATNYTAIWDELYTITKAAVTNGSITVSAESAIEGATVTLTATPAFRYVFGAWDVYKTGDESTKVTVTNNKFTMPEYAVTVSATFTADARKQILYLTTASTSSDKLYAALNSVETYNVIVEAPEAQTLTNYDLVVLHESISGNTANPDHKDKKQVILDIPTTTIPVLNTKSYFYTSARWNWGEPNAGKKPTGVHIDATYCNILSHPLFAGLTPDANDSIAILSSIHTDNKPIQPVGSFVSGKAGYTLASVPNNESGNGSAIHELTPAQRGVASGKYLMISVYSKDLNNLNANGQKLFQNAAAYLLSDETWTPKTLEVTIAAGIDNGSVDVDIDCAAEGDEITLNNTADPGYKLSAYNVYNTANPTITVEVSDGKFTMPDYAVTVSATFAELFAFTCNPADHGTVTATVGGEAATTAIAGEVVTLTITPESGYKLNSLIVKDAEAADVEVADNKFTMPASNVTVTATFVEDSGTGINNTDDSVKAVKVLRDGQIFIEKNGHVYNVFGACVK